MVNSNHTKSCNFCNQFFKSSRRFNSFCSDYCRFWSKVNICDVDQCWEFTRAIDISGYGKFSVLIKEIKAHRFSWESWYGEIPDGLLVLHKCDNPPCCNPYHLFLGTSQDNVADMISKGRQRKQNGSLNAQAKLSENSVNMIKKLIQNGTYLPKIANSFSVSLSTVYDIKDGRTWTHV